jgi:hypothetical protein
MSTGVQSIIFSGGALVVSVITLALTQVQRALDNRRIIRQQLTEVLSRITDMQIEGRKSPEAMEYLGPALTAQARLAAVLTDQLPPRLVSEIDYVSLASASFDPIEARQYYEKAISVARTAYYRRLARRGYASFLFESGDYEAGASQFNAALNEVTQPGDEAHAMRLDLYRTWAWYEQQAGHAERAAENLRLAQDELGKIENLALRRSYYGDQASKSAGTDGAAEGPRPAGPLTPMGDR